MPKIKLKFNKLVRDYAPEEFISDNIELKYEKVTGDNLIFHLKNKLLEEIQEVLETSSREELTEEISDIYDVLEAICNVYNISKEEINHKKQMKFSKRGGFSLGIFAHYIESEINNPEIQYFKNLSKKYPIIK